ncbi:lipopolysaccharide biosynthesis protein [Bacillus sp. AFS076308]|uniref:glycosyltransferase WbsX family protein n=1 Tax=Bacillus sp. AFS076308 TaxID=2033512 RepID=UPI000BF58D4D|nr:glycoside hydrolase family 99-like domain-containing protein [Bacillus sp. AFS076308]PFN80594.1 lipopolysaccharide biosynthesis protein [Bacillus sp. AFS076308]
MKTKARIIAFYLPQFHPVEVNDKYWGKGFTEWTNVAKAKPSYSGHYQPQVPADLGFYDLRLPEIRESQAEMARNAGVEGFCYWYYRFDKETRTLDMPIKEIMRLQKPEFPFCIGWANHDWSNKTWQKTKRFQQDVYFFKQQYLGEEDYTEYFYEVLPMFKDHRYIRVDEKPLFYVFNPDDVPDMSFFIKHWNKLAKENGLSGIYFVARADSCGKAPIVYNKEFINQGKERYDYYISIGFDAVNSFSFRRAEVLATGYIRKVWKQIKRKVLGYAINDHDYGKLMDNYYTGEDELDYVLPTIMPRRDRTPRSGRNALVYKNSTPEKFRKAVKIALKKIENKPEEHKILFLDSWNEWGEGSYMEPDIVFGRQYLEVLKEEIVDE